MVHAGRFLTALVLVALTAPASALDARPVPAQPLGKVTLGTGSGGDGSEIRVKPPAGGLAPTLSEILGRSANPLDFKTSTNTDADTIRALYAKWPDTHLVTISDVTRSYPAASIPRPSRPNPQDHVFLWPGPYPSEPDFRPHFPGLHIMPIGNRIEIFRGQPRPFDGGEDVRMVRDRTKSPGGNTNEQNAQLTLINTAKDSNSSEWPLLVTMDISGTGVGQHVGISSYSKRKGGGSSWNFVGGITDFDVNPTMGVAGMELALRATGGDANRLRALVDLIGKGERPNPASDNLYDSEIGSGIRITTDQGDVGYPTRTRVLRPLNINTLWGQNMGALDITTKEKVGVPLGSVLNYMKAYNGDDTFSVRSRRFAAPTGSNEHNTLAIDLVRHVGDTGNELAVLSLMPGYVETLNLRVGNEIRVGNTIYAKDVLFTDGLPVANDNASATSVVQGKFYRTPDGTVKIKF